MKLSIDFTEIGDEEEFFEALNAHTSTPIESVEMLSDFLAEKRDEPVEWEFFNLSVEQLEVFEALIEALENAEEENDSFVFKYYLEQFETE